MIGKRQVNPGTAAQTEKLRIENAALRSQIEGMTSHCRVRCAPILRVVIAVVAIVLIVLTVTTGWAKTTLLDPDPFVATLSPLPRNSAVAEALSIRVSDAVVEATRLEASITDALPPEIAFIAGPVTVAAGTLVASAAEGFIQTEAFTSVWNQALRSTHRAVTVLVSGSGAIVAEGGTVAIDLDTIAGPVLTAIADKGLDVNALAGDDFTLGQIVIVEADALGSAQAAVRLLDALGWSTALLAVL